MYTRHGGNGLDRTLNRDGWREALLMVAKLGFGNACHTVRATVVKEQLALVLDQSFDEDYVGDLPFEFPIRLRLEDVGLAASEDFRRVLPVEQHPANTIDEFVIGAIVYQEDAIFCDEGRRSGLDNFGVKTSRAPGKHRLIARVGPVQQVI